MDNDNDAHFVTNSFSWLCSTLNRNKMALESFRLDFVYDQTEIPCGMILEVLELPAVIKTR